MSPTRAGFDRRRFLKLGAATTGLALGCRGPAGTTAADQPLPEMRYRPLGGTGLQVSEIAFGAHGVDNRGLMRAALEAGINTFCTSGSYLDGLEEKALSEAITSPGAARDRLVVFTGNRVRPGISKQRVLDDIDASLRRLRTDYIDVYIAGELRSPADLELEPFHEAIEEAKLAGKVAHLGLSGHAGGMQALLNAAIDDGRFEVFFIKYDFVSYPDQDEILRRASRQGIGTVVFKINAGNRQREIEDLEAGGLSFHQATLKWALGNPDVASAAVTLTTFDQLRESMGAVGARLARSEVEMLRRYAEEMYSSYCRFCATCEAACPHQVAVADVMRCAMYFRHYGREKEAMQLYRELPARSTAAPCDACPGFCDSGCPFERRVRAELVQAHRWLSFEVA